MNIKNKRVSQVCMGAGLITVGLLLGGCGGSSSDKAGTKKDTTPANAQTLTGTAAVGNPIAGGTLTAKCADGSGFTNAVTTQANGTWSGTVANGALPCALQVTGGTPSVTLHSIATQAGNVNITPLTDLALALQVNTLSGQSLADWFAAPNAGSADFNSVAGSLTAAADALRTAMTAANFSLPADWVTGSTAIFNAAFSADPANDPYDKLLENLATAISSDANLTDYSALISSLTSGGSLPAAPVTGNNGGGAGNSYDPLSGGVGITGEVDGIRYTNSVLVSWDSYSLSAYGPHPSISDAHDSSSYWRLWYLPKEVGTYQCKTKVKGSTIQLSYGRTGVTYSNIAACEIKVISVDQSVITGSFTGKINVGADELLIEDGFFRYQEPSQ